MLLQKIILPHGVLLYIYTASPNSSEVIRSCGRISLMLLYKVRNNRIYLAPICTNSNVVCILCESFVFAKRNLSAWQFKVQKLWAI